MRFGLFMLAAATAAMAIPLAAMPRDGSMAGAVDPDSDRPAAGPTSASAGAGVPGRRPHGGGGAGMPPAANAHMLRADERYGPRSVHDGGNGVVYVGGPIGHASVRGLTVDGAYRVIETGVGASGDLTIADIRATNLQRGLARIRGDLTGTIRDCEIDFAPEPQMPPNLPEGIAFDGTAHDFTIRNVTVRNSRMRMDPNRYWNGDGISSELGNHGLRFSHVAVYDSTDGGFDLKSSDSRLDDTISSGNSRNYRFWRSIEAGTITSIEPVVRGGRTRPAHIWTTGKFGRPVIHIARLIVRATTTAPVILVEDGEADITIDSADIQVPPGTPLVIGSGAHVHWLSGEPRLR